MKGVESMSAVKMMVNMVDPNVLAPVLIECFQE
jgi:hypothetical protein